MDPQDFQTLAKELLTDGRPAAVRSAVSRSYYAAYNIGEQALRGMGARIPQTAAGHLKVGFCFNNSEDETLRVASSQLAALRTRRNHADYHMGKQEIEAASTATVLLEQADRIIEDITDRCNSGDRENIIAAIKDWSQRTGEGLFV